MKNQTNHKRVVYSVLLIVMLLVSAINVASEPNSETSPAFIVIDESQNINDLAKAIRELNGKVTHVFPPQALIGELSTEAEEQLAQSFDLTVYWGPVDLEKCEGWTKELTYAATAWNYNYMGFSATKGLNELPISPEPPREDTEIVPDISDSLDESQAAFVTPQGASFSDTSAYFAGSVAVGVIFLESNGTIDEDMEDWTAEEEANATAEIQNGLNWLAIQEPGANLTFVYEWHYSVPVGYEPISRPHTDDDLWEQQAMYFLGHANADYLVSEYSYANALRETYQTDWAFIIYVVDDSEDEDNAFADNVYAYSHLGGPRMVVTYSNSVWGIANLDSVVAHEACHLFWALDEHCSSQVENKAVSGYFAGENANSEWDGESCQATLPCIMKGEPIFSSQVDSYTRVQLGWVDADADGVLDVLETTPAVTVEQGENGFTGTATAGPLPCENPLKEGNAVSLFTLTTVEYSVDQGDWTPAAPADGAFDSVSEAFTIVCDLEGGNHSLAVRAQDSKGTWSEPAVLEVSVEEEGTEEVCALVSELTATMNELVNVVMTVKNTGEAEVLGIVPVLNAPDTVEKVSGPLPEEADIAAGESQAFTWEYTLKTTDVSDVTFSGSATGVTEAGAEVSSVEVQLTVELVHTADDDAGEGEEDEADNAQDTEGESDDAQDTEEGDVTPVVAADIAVLLYGVIEMNTITLSMEVTNAGTAPYENISPSDLTLTCTGTVAATVLSGPTPQPPIALEPGETKTFVWTYTANPGPLGGTAVFTGFVSTTLEGGTVVSNTGSATLIVPTPAVLSTILIATPPEVRVGDTFTVVLTVQNIGQAAAADVVPSELTVSGTGAVEAVSGPSRTSVRVEGRTFEIIHWSFMAKGEGTVTFACGVQGTDTSTGTALSVAAKESNSVTIKAQGSGSSGSNSNSNSNSNSDSNSNSGNSSPPSQPACVKAEETIKKVKELLEEARKRIEEKEKKNVDVSFCKNLLPQIALYLEQAQTYLRQGKCEEAYRSAILALVKVYELLNFLKGK